jgi:hypothetical protein
MRRHGSLLVLVTDKLLSYGATMKEIGNVANKNLAAGLTIRPRIHISPFEGENGPCCASCGCEGYRNPLLSTAQSTPISIKSVISTTIKFQVEPCRRSRRVASTLFRIDSCPLRQIQTGPNWSDSAMAAANIAISMGFEALGSLKSTAGCARQ